MTVLEISLFYYGFLQFLSVSLGYELPVFYPLSSLCCLAIDNLMHWKNIILVLALFSWSSYYIYKTFYSLSFSTIISVILNYFSQRKYQFKNSNCLMICFYFVFYVHSNFLPGIIQLPEVTPGVFCCLLFMLMFVHLVLSPRLGYLLFWTLHLKNPSCSLTIAMIGTECDISFTFFSIFLTPGSINIR